MQFQVPQFIETEDKILGPLSLRQFIYLSIAAGAAMILYFIFTFWVWLFFSLVIVGATAALVLVKINGRPLTILAQHALFFYWNPQTYVWMPDQPNLPKNEETVRQATSGFSMEKVVSGFALKNAWHHVQVGKSPAASKPEREAKRTEERFDYVQKITGESRVAKRVDYR